MTTRELTKQEQQEVAAYIVVNFYLHDKKVMYRDYMEKTVLLARWLLPLEPEYINIWPSIPGADVCTSCKKIFGTTSSGRLRYGCWSCRNPAEALTDYEVQQIASILHLGIAVTEYIIAHQIVEIEARKEKLLATSNTQKTQLQQFTPTTQLPS